MTQVLERTVLFADRRHLRVRNGCALRVAYAALQRAAMVRHVHRRGRLRLLR